MALAFVSKEKRDQVAERLATLAVEMIRAGDQGRDGSIRVTNEMIEDIRMAACVVGLADIREIEQEQL